MKLNKTRMLLVIFVLGLAALACNFGGGDDPVSEPSTGQTDETPGEDTSTSDTQTDTQDDAPVSDDTATSDDSGSETGDDASAGDDSTTESGDSSGTDDSSSPVVGGPDMIDLDDPLLYKQPEEIETYHVNLVNTFDAVAADGSPVNGSVDMVGQSRIDPFETMLEFYTDGDAVFGGGEVFTFTQIIEEQYIVSPSLPQCMSGIPGFQQNPFEVLLDAGGLLSGEAQRLPDQVINGLDTYVYEITTDNVDELDAAGADVQEITDGWIAFAQEGFYVVQLHIEGLGTNTLLSQNETLVGDIFYELNYFDFNQPVNIEIPFGCGDSGEENTDYPVPDDATNFVTFGGIVTFNSAMSVDDLVSLYTTEMTALGCSSPDELSSPAGTILTFSGCPAGTVQVSVVPNPDGGNLVSIIELP